MNVHRWLGLAIIVGAGLGPRAALASPGDGPKIEHSAVARAMPGQPVLIRARITDPDGVFAPSVFFRLSGTKGYASVAMQSLGQAMYQAVIAGERIEGAGLDYFIEAFDALGHGPSQVGSPKAPLRVQIGTVELPSVIPPSPTSRRAHSPTALPTASLAGPAEDDGGITGTWWFWTVVGIVVAGGVAGAAVALTRNDGPVNAVSVNVRGPDPSDGL